jgi:ATP adenylyltransferase
MYAYSKELSECRLCEIINKPEQRREIQDTLLDQTEHFQCLPALGAFIEGYLIIVSKSHFFNTGCLNIKIIRELEDFIIKIKNFLKNIYKITPIIFEHGSMGKRNNAGSSIEHHHIHILPVNLPLVPAILLKKFALHEQLKSMKELVKYNKKQIPYIYFSPSSGEHHVFEVPILPRQYLRQILAVECDVPKDWDWRKKPFIENIHSFITKVMELGGNNGYI